MLVTIYSGGFYEVYSLKYILLLEAYTRLGSYFFWIYLDLSIYLSFKLVFISKYILEYLHLEYM